MTREWGRAPAAEAIALVLCALSLGGGCGDSSECDIETESRSIGGAGLIDCGFAEQDDRGDVDRCARSAFERDQTFRALYELDDGRLQALVHAAGGAYLLLQEGEEGGLERADCAGAELRSGVVTCSDPASFEPVCR